MKIYVKAEHIKLGKRKQPSACPIARATKEQMKCIGVPDVYNTCIKFGVGGKIKLPPKARKFVRDFDHMRPVKPFSFTI